jgi:hypothetical protein
VIPVFRIRLQVSGPSSIYGKRPCAHDEEKHNRRKHCEIGSYVAHHEPETLFRTEELRDLCRCDGSEVDDQERNIGYPCEEANQHQEATGYLKCPHKVGREIGVWEANLREAQHPPDGVGELENALSEEDQANGNPNEHCCPRGYGRERTVQRIHQGILFRG